MVGLLDSLLPEADGPVRFLLGVLTFLLTADLMRHKPFLVNLLIEFRERQLRNLKLALEELPTDSLARESCYEIFENIRYARATGIKLDKAARDGLLRFYQERKDFVAFETVKKAANHVVLNGDGGWSVRIPKWPRLVKWLLFIGGATASFIGLLLLAVPALVAGSGLRELVVAWLTAPGYFVIGLPLLFECDRLNAALVLRDLSDEENAEGS